MAKRKPNLDQLLIIQADYQYLRDIWDTLFEMSDTPMKRGDWETYDILNAAMSKIEIKCGSLQAQGERKWREIKKELANTNTTNYLCKIL